MWSCRWLPVFRRKVLPPSSCCENLSVGGTGFRPLPILSFFSFSFATLISIGPCAGVSDQHCIFIVKNQNRVSVFGVGCLNQHHVRTSLLTRNTQSCPHVKVRHELVSEYNSLVHPLPMCVGPGTASDWPFLTIPSAGLL